MSLILKMFALILIATPAFAANKSKGKWKWVDEDNNGKYACGYFAPYKETKYKADEGYWNNQDVVCNGKTYPNEAKIGWYDSNGNGEYSCGIKHSANITEDFGLGEGYKKTRGENCFNIEYPGTRGWFDTDGDSRFACGIKANGRRNKGKIEFMANGEGDKTMTCFGLPYPKLTVD